MGERINVAVTGAMLAAIDKVIASEQVTLTEAVRRLLLRGEAVTDAWAVGDAVIVRSRDGSEQTVVDLSGGAR